MHGNVKYFVIFCNLDNILDVGADTSNHAVKVVKIENRGFLRMRNAVAETALKNCSLHWPLIFLTTGHVVKAACSGKLATLSACTWQVRGSNSTTLANLGAITKSNSKRKRGALPPRYSSRAARLQYYAVFLPFWPHNNKPARLT